MPVDSIHTAKQESSRTLLLIGLFKLFKAAALIVTGVGVLHLVNRDLGAVVDHWVQVLRVDPDNKYVNRVLEKILRVDHKQLTELSVASFIYAAVFLTEGTGLILRKRWAEYLTIVSTGLLMPLEVYELVKHPTWMKAAVLVINAVIVAYLVYHIRAKTGSGAKAA